MVHFTFGEAAAAAAHAEKQQQQLIPAPKSCQGWLVLCGGYVLCAGRQHHGQGGSCSCSQTLPLHQALPRWSAPPPWPAVHWLIMRQCGQAPGSAAAAAAAAGHTITSGKHAAAAAAAATGPTRKQHL